MTRFYCIGPCILLLPALAAAADPAAARERWLRGNPAESRRLCESLAKQPEHAIAAAIGLSRLSEDEGKLDEAAATLDAALKNAPDDPALLARRAQLAYSAGKLDAASKAAEAAIARQDDQFLARWVRANLRLDRGEIEAADRDFRWFVRTYTARDQASKPIVDADTLLLIAQAGAINARWHNLGDQFKFILNEVLNDALKADSHFWPAEHLAGELLLEKYNRGEAIAAFDKALAINPRAVPALVGKGRAALQQFELKDAEQFANQALAVNEHARDALRLLADVHFLSGEVPDAGAVLERARAVNPVEESTLGRLAACRFVEHDRAGFDALCAEVAARDPKPGRFYFELASRLDDRRLFDDSSRYFRKAIECWPHFGEAKTGLGMLAMRLGQEDEGRKLLSEARAADPFNVRIANSLKVLNHLQHYSTLQTPHFILRFDSKSDRVLGAFMADAVEREYDRLAAQFGYKPAQPILIEVFNRHDMFSGRTIGVPDLHTIGACTGRMVAMVSPRGQGIRKPFNWGRVIRHELVHIFNLEQTNFQVPHWLTEGLAVRNEGFPRSPEWVRLLAERTAADDLLNLNTINLGFMRPRSPSEWTLAYCQAQLYVEYLSKAHGEKAIAGLLAAYRDGLDTPAALKRVCGADVPAFEAGYKKFVREVASKASGRPPEKPMTLAQLQAASEKSPDDLNLAARLAEQYLKRRRAGDARSVAERILAKDPKNGLALFVKAQLLLAAGDDEPAQQLLELASRLDPPEPRVLRALGKQHFDAARFDQAEAMYRRGRQIEPMDYSWLEDLARVYKQTGDEDKRIEVLQELAPSDADDLAMRRELAELFVKRKRWTDAARWAREALEIDVEDAAARAALLQSLTALGRNDEVGRLNKIWSEP